jgi:hydroxyethylthiazole kinase-like uncharacterized protein yjeF
MIINEGVMENFPWVKPNAHKHSRGRLAVFSGGELHTGAARLVANCGARIGAGWVVMFAPIDAARIIAAHETSIMVEEYEYSPILPSKITDFRAIVIGPALGFGKGKYAAIKSLLGLENKLVLDADALSMIANDTSQFGLREIIKERQFETILTPHEGEFSRIFAQSADSLEEKIEITQYGAAKINATIVHKGAQTVIAAPNGETAVLENSTPWLATAGTGDCLAGMIGGLVAQGLDGFTAAKIAVYLHAECGKTFGAGLLAQDIPNLIPEILDEFAPDALRAK